jgi:hypothetical protein
MCSEACHLYRDQGDAIHRCYIRIYLRLQHWIVVRQ